MEGSDRRNTPRVPVGYRLDVVDGDLQPIGFVVDLSCEGVRVVVFDHDLEDLHRLRIRLPAWVGMGDELELDGRFVWRRPCEEGAEGGFLFDPADKKRQEQIYELVAKIEMAVQNDGASLAS